jgi:hypothetical protein
MRLQVVKLKRSRHGWTVLDNQSHCYPGYPTHRRVCLLTGFTELHARTFVLLRIRSPSAVAKAHGVDKTPYTIYVSLHSPCHQSCLLVCSRTNIHLSPPHGHPSNCLACLARPGARTPDRFSISLITPSLLTTAMAAECVGVALELGRAKEEES